MKAQITINGKTYEAEIADEDVAEIESVEPTGRFVPKLKERYWFIGSGGETYETVNADFGVDRYHIRMGNSYHTEADVEKVKAYREAEATIRADADWWMKPEDVAGWLGYSIGSKLYSHNDSEPGNIPGAIYFETEEKLQTSFARHLQEWNVYCDGRV